MTSRTFVVSRRGIAPPIGMLLVVASLNATAILAAPPQSFARPQEDGTIRIEMTPAAPDDPTRTHALLPPFAEQRNENAAVFYGKVKAEQSHFFGSQEIREAVWASSEQSLDELAKRSDLDAIAGLPNGNGIYEFLHRAARCRHCDWQLPLHEENYWMILLPDIQECRTFARLLTLRARLQIARGDFEGAESTLRDGYALARHVGTAESLVAAYVSVSIQMMMHQVLMEQIGGPGAPNLFWALSELSESPIDPRVGWQAERSALELSFEFARRPNESHDAAWWNEQLQEVWDLLRQMSAGYYSPGPIGERLRGWESHPESLTMLAIRGYPIARRGLIDQGFDAAEIESMPVAQVILLHTYRQYRTVTELDYRTTLVPYHESKPLAALAAEHLRSELERGESLPLTSRLHVDLTLGRAADIRIRREHALLMLLEALRWYGAEHQGKLPATLADLSPIPVPIDPSTGQPFEYRLEGDRAIVTSPESLGAPFPFRYEIRLIDRAE